MHGTMNKEWRDINAYETVLGGPERNTSHRTLGADGMTI